jgi:hypothetical protein
MFDGMMDKRQENCQVVDASKAEPMPTGDGIDVGTAAVGYLCLRFGPLIAADLQKRIDMGEKKYGTRLKTHNGRNALMDAYQEALDGINYAMQAYIEGIGSIDEVSMFASIAANLNIRMSNARTK